MATPTKLTNYITLGHFTFLANYAVSDEADLRQHTRTMNCIGDRLGQIAAFWDCFE